LKLVSKLAQEHGSRGRRDAEPSDGAGDRGRISTGARLSGADEVPSVDGAGEDPDTPAGDPALPQHGDSLALLLALAGVNDAASLAQVLAANAGPDQTVDTAAVAARVANGSATDADLALVRAALAVALHGEAPTLPDAAMLAHMTKASSQAEARRAGQPMPETVTKVTVVGRETHLSPVLTAAAAAAELAPVAAHGDRPSGPRSPGGAQATDNALPGPTHAAATETADVVNPHTAVIGTREARSNANPRADGSPMGGQHPAAEPAIDTIDQGSGGGAFPATSIARVDQIVSSAPPLSVAQQIADRVAGEAAQLVGQSGRPEPSGLGLAQPSGSPVKVIHIQLQPDGLGAVSIRMAVKDQALQLALVADRGETAGIIQRERDTLSKLLRSAGYLIEGVDVRAAAPGAGAVSTPTMDGQGGTQMQGGGQSRGSPADGRSPGTGSQDNSRPSGFGNRRNGEEEQAGTRRGGGGGVYV
jgi:flagellar hook-length control protein FliK